MPRKVRHEHTFTDVCIRNRNDVLVAAIADELPDELDHSLVFSWDSKEWLHWAIENAIGSICVVEEPRPTVFCMGTNGEITLFTLPGRTIEQVDASPDGPSDLVHLKCIRLIGRHVYVAGMARRVYRRVRPNNWQPIDQGMFVPRGQRTVAVGFNAICGLSESAIYAVGYQGEIWYYDGTRWIQEDSPTNLALTCVRCIREDEVYAAGLVGTLLRGRHGQWEIIDHGATDDDFWGMAWFDGRLYVACYQGVFVLENDVLTMVDMKRRRKLSTAYLDANDGVLWSVGQKDIAYSENGKSWIEVPRPN
jgi:hypothetical protein